LPFFSQATEANVVCCIVLSAPPLLLNAHSIGHLMSPVQSFPSEFHSEALRRGCERYGIRLDYRPPGHVYTGGHIERYLGTLMRRIHGVPGTTMSNVKARGRYDSEKHSVLSLRELESWLTLEIGGRYHHAIHRGLHMTPFAAWARALGKRPVPSPEYPEKFVLDFLPVISRKIGRSGFQMFHIRYWDPLLSHLFTESQRLFVRYDPRNLAKVWVPIPEIRSTTRSQQYPIRVRHGQANPGSATHERSGFCPGWTSSCICRLEFGCRTC
jgi:Mu transposase-like protein